MLADYPEELREVAQLLVSEVVTNALVHGGSAVQLHIGIVDSRVRISVDDRSVVIPTARRTSPDSDGGRGLVLVDSLAKAWGVVPTAGGKRVWFGL